MKSFHRIFLATVVVMGPFMSLQAAKSTNAPADDGSNPVFATPHCDVNAAVGALAERLGSQPQPAHDGYVPWPDIFGHWLNTERDVYLTIYAQERENSKFTVLNVVLRSVCDDRVLARGAKVITDDDWGRSFLTVRLRNYGLLGDRLVASVRVPSPETDKNTLEVKIHSLPEQDSGEVRLMDWFYSWKF
jgi:hypothetical protein